MLFLFFEVSQVMGRMTGDNLCFVIEFYSMFGVITFLEVSIYLLCMGLRRLGTGLEILITCRVARIDGL